MTKTTNGAGGFDAGPEVTETKAKPGQQQHHLHIGPAGQQQEGRKRLQWLATLCACRKYSALTHCVAGLLAYKYSDRHTGETFAGVKTLMAETGAEKDSIQKILSDLRNEGWLTKTRSHAGGLNPRPTAYRLTIPTAAPARPAAATAAKPRKAQYADEEPEEPF